MERRRRVKQCRAASDSIDSEQILIEDIKGQSIAGYPVLFYGKMISDRIFYLSEKLDEY